MEDLTLKAVWSIPQTGKFEYSWGVRAGVGDTKAFLNKVKLNGDTLVIPSENLAGVDLKQITIAVKAKNSKGQRFETEFSFNMHKKPEIGFVMPEAIEAGKRFDIQINFDGAKLKSAEVWVIKVPAGGYKDPKSGKVITQKDAKKQIEDLEKENKKKMFKKKGEEEKKKEMKSAAGGDDNILKVFKLSSRDFEKGMNWWKKGFALKASKEDYNVLLKLEACGVSGCFVRQKYLKATKLSDENREKLAKE